MSAPGITREDVRMAYRLLLGREPESDAVVDAHCAAHADLAGLRAGFMASAEFRAQVAEAASHDAEFGARLASGYFAPPLPIAVDGPPDLFARLTQRIRDQWTTLGESDPYWSVITDEQYRAARMDAAAEDRFRQTGAGSAGLIDLVAARTGIAPATDTCIELGCGVGRITRHLAARFGRVVAVDISPGNIALCRRYLADEGVRNVETVLIRDIEELGQLPPADYFYSMIVLQHNPPPMQRRMLEILLGTLRPRGQCLFQTVADLPGYSFEIESYLATPSPDMEIHCLPMAVVHRLMRDAGLAIDTVRMDPWVSGYGSYTFSGHREG